MVQPLLRVIGVSKNFGSVNILKNVSLDVMPGEIIGLIGSSGSGKTTLLNSIIGFYAPDDGSVLFYSDFDKKKPPSYKAILGDKHEAKHFYGFAAQYPSFYENLTARENLEYFGKLYDLSADVMNDNIRTLLKIMNLESNEHILAKNLSGGMERRLDIACALVHNPKLLILDEPTADLDPSLRDHLIAMISKINKQGTTILLSSHHLSELENLCDRIAIVKDNMIVAVGSIDEIRQKFTNYEEILIHSKPGNYERIGSVIKKKFKSIIKGFSVKNGDLLFYCEDPKKHLSLIIRSIESLGEKIIDLKFSKPSLDQIFLSLNEGLYEPSKPVKRVVKKNNIVKKKKRVVKK